MNYSDTLAIYLEEPISVLRLDPNAVLPVRANPNDSGCDLTPIGIFKQLRDDTWLLNTGLAMKPPRGTYIDLVGRSSISKTPVLISNAVGVMDTTYRGDYLIAVTLKNSNDIATFDPQELVNGKPLAQLVLRPLIIAPIKEVGELDETVRGDGGFGSTDKALASSEPKSLMSSLTETAGEAVEAVGDAASSVGDVLSDVAEGVCGVIAD